MALSSQPLTRVPLVKPLIRRAGRKKNRGGVRVCAHGDGQLSEEISEETIPILRRLTDCNVDLFFYFLLYFLFPNGSRYR
jgi:hypothetical protein